MDPSKNIKVSVTLGNIHKQSKMFEQIVFDTRFANLTMKRYTQSHNQFADVN